MIKFSSKMSDFVINWQVLVKNDHFIPNKIQFSRPLNPNRTGCTYLTLFRTVVNRTARGYGTYQCHAQYPEFNKLRVLSSADFSLFKLIKSNLLFLQFLIFSFFIKCFKSVTQQFLNFEFEKNVESPKQLPLRNFRTPISRKNLLKNRPFWNRRSLIYFWLLMFLRKTLYEEIKPTLLEIVES